MNCLTLLSSLQSEYFTLIDPAQSLVQKVTKTVTLTHHGQTVDEDTAAVDHRELVQHLTPVPGGERLTLTDVAPLNLTVGSCGTGWSPRQQGIAADNS